MKTFMQKRLKDHLKPGKKDSYSIVSRYNLRSSKKPILKKPNYKESGNECGKFVVYMYTKMNGDYYIGQTGNLEQRKLQHIERERELLQFKILHRGIETRSSAIKLERKCIEQRASEKCLNKNYNNCRIDYKNTTSIG